MTYWKSSWGGSKSYNSWGGHSSKSSYSHKSSYDGGHKGGYSHKSGYDGGHKGGYSHKSGYDGGHKGGYSHKSGYDGGHKGGYSHKSSYDWKGYGDKHSRDWKDKYCDKDEEPDPIADEACVCSDESVTIDVLANDNDPDGNGLTITAIDGTAVAEGDTVVLASGASVTLTGGQLVYSLEGADDFDALLITESGADQFTYTVEDGNGDEATANVDVEVKGAVNTLETIVESLPTMLSFTITNEAALDATSTEAFTLTLSSSDDRLDGLVIEEAYCLSLFEALQTNATIVADVYLADAASVPAGALDQDTFKQGDMPATARENLDLINWILNQDFGSQDNGDTVDGGARPGETYSDAEIQAAIWALTDFQAFTLGTIPDSGTFENAVEIYFEALNTAEAEGFTPGEGDIIGLFLDPKAESEAAGHFQPFIIGVPFDDLAQDCLCA